MSFTDTYYVDDIYSDCAYHWLMFLKHKDGYYLRKEAKDKKKYEDDVSQEAFKSYCNINDQIIKEFGKDESFITRLETEEKIAMLKLDYIINKNGFSQTLYELEEVKNKEIKEAENNGDEFDLNKEIGIISKYLGGGIINIKEVTIHQYLTAKQLLKNG